MSKQQCLYNGFRHFLCQLAFAFKDGDQSFNLEVSGDKSCWYSDWPALKIIWGSEACFNSHFISNHLLCLVYLQIRKNLSSLNTPSESTSPVHLSKIYCLSDKPSSYLCFLGFLTFCMAIWPSTITPRRQISVSLFCQEVQPFLRLSKWVIKMIQVRLLLSRYKLILVLYIDSKKHCSQISRDIFQLPKSFGKIS